MTETPEGRPATGIRAWFRRRLDSPLKQAGAALGAAVVVGAVAGTAWLALTGDDGAGQPAFVNPPGFALSPEGDDVPRLTPIRVTFASAPGERSGEKLLALEPAVPGSYAWLSDRTLVFQPDFPGLLRGSAYSVTVPPRPETGLTERSAASSGSPACSRSNRSSPAMAIAKCRSPHPCWSSSAGRSPRSPPSPPGPAGLSWSSTHRSKAPASGSTPRSTASSPSASNRSPPTPSGCRRG